MKRWNLFVFCAVLSVSAFAQDIIITRDAKRIESKIQEVSPTEVRYMEWGNLEGPVFVLPTQDICVITFQNGSIRVFNNAPQRTQKEFSESSEPGFILRSGNDEYILEQNGVKTQMDKDAYVRFIQSSCPAAYKEYKKGTRLMGSGWGLFAGGIVTTLCIGVPLYYATNDYYIYDGYAYYHRTSRYSMINAGISMMVIGSTATITSIPLLGVGYHKMHNSHDVYNVQCGMRNRSVSLNGQVSTDGIGLALCF